MKCKNRACKSKKTYLDSITPGTDDYVKHYEWWICKECGFRSCKVVKDD